jgi:hypothetical protein
MLQPTVYEARLKVKDTAIEVGIVRLAGVSIANANANNSFVLGRTLHMAVLYTSVLSV